MNMKAFTLVETLVAITVLTFAILGPFHVAQNVLSSSYIARDQLIATTLAQEGVEYVRLVRDSNFVYNLHNSAQPQRLWLFGLDGQPSGPNCYTNACVIDATQLLYTAPAVISCGDLTCTGRPLYIADTPAATASNLYTQVIAGNTKTKFTRSVKLTQVAGDSNQTRVTVTVTWEYHGPHTVVLTETLRNWL
jgi:Tfp pilus assembly protein PilV